MAMLKFAEGFREQFMRLDVSMPLEAALDVCWQLLKDCFDRDEVVIKKDLKDKYWTEEHGEDSPE